MKNKVFKSVLAIFVGTLMLTGCSQSDTPSVGELQKQLDEQITINKELQTQVEDLQTEVSNLKQEKEQLISEVREADGAIINLYTVNVDTLATEEIGKITAAVDAEGNIKDIEEILDFMAKELSKQVFEGLPIDVDLETLDGKQIAVIDLEEDNNLSVGWASNFLQGSTGAAITDLTLKETFLQKSYEGKWIDGIKILYEGKAPEFDHMPDLGKVIYR